MAIAQNVLIVHGIGWGEKGEHYADEFQALIAGEFSSAIDRLNLGDVDPADARPDRALRFAAACWSPVTQTPEDALLDLLDLEPKPGEFFARLTYLARRQMVGLLGDVIAYEASHDDTVYREIHACLDACLSDLAQGSAAGRLPDGYAPLTVIGHSLGSVIASDYLWDHTRARGSLHQLEEHRMVIKNIVLLGSPMALYALRNNPHADKATLASSLTSPVCVEPGTGLWLNLFDAQDLVALPLKPIKAYAEAGVIDRPVNVGNLLTSWNPASHIGYWTSDEVAVLIGSKLALDWAAANSAGFVPRYAAAVQTYRDAVIQSG